MTLDRIVLVEWDDATQPIPEWTSLGDLDSDQSPVTCSSVGWIVGKTARTLTLAPNQTNEQDNHVSGLIQIPVSAVRRMVELKPDE